MFKIVLVGRPNVGKSTLFNLLAGKKLAIVEDIAGVTVDIKEADGSLNDLKFKIIDTGGFTVDDQDTIKHKIWEHAQKAIQNANCVLFIVDAKQGITEEDKIFAKLLRKFNTKVILCINKIDSKESRNKTLEIYELGFKTTVEISATQSIGLFDLYEVLKPLFEEYQSQNNETDISKKSLDISIAVIGKPNTGKSTLINKLLKEERLITGDKAGLTRDAISTYLTYKNKTIRLIDTAGLRKKSKIKEKLEVLSKNDTIRTIIFAQVVILVISAEEGLTKQDLTIANYVINEGRALVIVINKIDLIKNKEKLLKETEYTLEEAFSQVKGIKIITISALCDINLNKIFDISLGIYEKWNTLIKTSFLNRWLEGTLAKHQPPIVKGRRVKIKLITQIKSRPPTFNLWTNTKDGIPDSYTRYIQNQLYKSFNLWGTPLRINVKKANNPYTKK